MKNYLKSLLLIILITNLYFGQKLDISKSQITIADNIDKKIQVTAFKMLNEEILKRTNIDLKKEIKWDSNNNIIAVCLSNSKKIYGKDIPQSKNINSSENNKEGFRLISSTIDSKNIIWIIGADSRGILFGIGEFLRRAELVDNKILIESNIDFSSSPEYPIRGHQLGYRNTANSWDVWSVEQFEQYIRDLVIFGTNAIENIPIGDKGDDSPHFKLTRKEMNVELSKICDNYDVDYWVWTPATIDLSNEELFKSEVAKHEAYYKETPRLNDVFFPGGDPGNNHPKYVMPFLKELHAKLIKYHPNAGIWISLQGFSEEQIDYFYNYLNEEKPTWLKGVVSGPSSPPIAETRFRLPKQYLHRQYPDVTHSVRCEFPALNFDQAFALTIGREGINPQPEYYAKIHGDYAQFTNGFVTYSDGCHDDVNKIIWSQRGWNTKKSVNEILKEYGRFFFGNNLAQETANGILALEKNWLGPLKANGSVETTFSFWKNLEKNNPQLNNNWRWLMLQLRAEYDTYIRRRQIYEKDLELKANAMLADLNENNYSEKMNSALMKINEADSNPISQDLKKDIEKYCDELFKIIGLQTSVKLYQASGLQRGCILDFVDYPLNNRWWYQDEFKKINEMNSSLEKIERLKTIRDWENPGAGSYYDDISNIANSEHVKTTVFDAVDFGWWDEGYSRMRLSSQVYQNDPVLEYENLDPNARYLIRITGYGDALLRIDSERMEPVLYNKELEKFKEFVVPKSLVGDGKIKITFDRPEESHLNWRDYSRISDVWLIKR
ncbi:MAG: hypothetical protein IPK06_03820 [Ignavibacteriae bacterium]|nr:hypothetical protein [Ignavibacteriota bacterium]